MFYHILDTDLYKFTTSYAYMKLFPDAECTFTFTDRNAKRRTIKFIDEYKRELQNLSTLMPRLTNDELVWLSTYVPFIPAWYWEWLQNFSYDFKKVQIGLDNDGVLQISITDKCYKASLYEIPCLYLVQEVENSIKKNKPSNLWKTWLDEKIKIANDNDLKFSEFGTRRRFSQEIQEEVIKTLKENAKTCVGTSNVYFAMKYNMTPIGTHPHEWFMFHGAQFGYKNANHIALENWVDVYQGDLGIALSDTYTTDAFFRNFSLKQAKLFDGVRQDSGDEYEFIGKTIAFYISRGIDPMSKTIIFSNALNFNKAKEINNFCKGKIRASFGIGTNLTNDCGVIPENIVMKMSKCRMTPSQPWQKTIKISDDIGKHMGDPYEIKCAGYELGLINKI